LKVESENREGESGGGKAKTAAETPPGKQRTKERHVIAKPAGLKQSK